MLFTWASSASHERQLHLPMATGQRPCLKVSLPPVSDSCCSCPVVWLLHCCTDSPTYHTTFSLTSSPHNSLSSVLFTKALCVFLFWFVIFVLFLICCIVHLLKLNRSVISFFISKKVGLTFIYFVRLGCKVGYAPLFLFLILSLSGLTHAFPKSSLWKGNHCSYIYIFFWH